MRRLLAIGDLHLSHKFNREAFQSLEPHEDDGLILCASAEYSCCQADRSQAAMLARKRNISEQPSN